MAVKKSELYSSLWASCDSLRGGMDSSQYKIVLSESEKRFFADISRILSEGRHRVHTAVNSAMVETYWNIGRRIVEQEQQGKERANYGDQLLVKLSRYLSGTFGKGFSVANLWNFRQFFLTWPNEEILYTVCRELSWSSKKKLSKIP
jgi:hypothetical protein